MSFRPNESSTNNQYSRSEMRSSQGPTSSDITDEGCPVVEESGTVCAETKTLEIIKEFRKVYEDCVQKMEDCGDDNGMLKRIAPFMSIVENILEQNTMLVETVQELEQEATKRVVILQDRLNQSAEQVADKINGIRTIIRKYQEDVNSLVEVIRRIRETGCLDASGLSLNSICHVEVYGYCPNCSLDASGSEHGSVPEEEQEADQQQLCINLQLVQEPSNNNSCYCQCCL